MSYTLTVENAPVDEIPMSQLGVGEVAVVVSCPLGDYTGHTVLRTYSGVVSLSEPNTCWSKPVPSTISVRKLPRGTKLTLEVK